MESIELLDRLLYRDGLMLVVNKPAGIPVHAPPGGGLALEHYMDALRFGLPRRPSLAHRLDRATSGCLVLGRHPKALRRLGRLFATGQITKHYWAVVTAKPPEESGTMDWPLLKRNKEGKQWRMVVDPEGKPARTNYRLMGCGEHGYWIELSPLTGRTHQLRVHCAYGGFPILGDFLYGIDQEGSGYSLQLHARSIEVPLSTRRPPVIVKAPPPAHMLPLLRGCGYVASD